MSFIVGSKSALSGGSGGTANQNTDPILSIQLESSNTKFVKKYLNIGYDPKPKTFLSLSDFLGQKFFGSSELARISIADIVLLDDGKIFAFFGQFLFDLFKISFLVACSAVIEIVDTVMYCLSVVFLNKQSTEIPEISVPMMVLKLHNKYNKDRENTKLQNQLKNNWKEINQLKTLLIIKLGLIMMIKPKIKWSWHLPYKSILK